MCECDCVSICSSGWEWECVKVSVRQLVRDFWSECLSVGKCVCVWDLQRYMWQNMWVSVPERVCICQCVWVWWCVCMCMSVWRCLWMSIYKYVSVSCVCKYLSLRILPRPLCGPPILQTHWVKDSPKCTPLPLFLRKGTTSHLITQPEIWESYSSHSSFLASYHQISNRFPLFYFN